MLKQVDADHYRFENYLSLPRWNSLWHQLRLIKSMQPKSVLEVGPGPGCFKAIALNQGINIETLDIDPDLKPDHLGVATALPMTDDVYDLVCAFQVLEHLPFDQSIQALDEFTRVAKRNVVISLPDSLRLWRYLLHVPKFGEKSFLLTRPKFKAPVHQFDGEHYWEINKKGYELRKVIQAMSQNPERSLETTFRPFENPTHRFFVFTVNT